MPHEHQVAVADDRGQDVVEVVSYAACELADDLHLGCLRDLPLELCFFAIVLEQQQDRGVAESAQAGDGQRDRLRRLRRQAHRKITRHCRATGVAAHRVGHRGLVFLDDQIARINRNGRAEHARGLAERLVHGQEASVAVNEREADRKHVEQRLEIRRLGQRCAFGAVEQKESARAPVFGRVGRDVDRSQKSARFPLRNQAHFAAFSFDEIAQVDASDALVGTEGALDKWRVGGKHEAIDVDHHDEHTGRSQLFAGGSSDPPGDRGEDVGRRWVGKAPQQKVAVRSNLFDLDGA